MTFLVLTRKGYDDLAARSEHFSNTLWINLGVLSPAELATLRSSGIEVTNFNRHIDASNLSEAVATIREHYPDQPVWVEHDDEL